MKNICLHFASDKFTFYYPNTTMYRIGDKQITDADFWFENFSDHYEEWLSDKNVIFVFINPLHWHDCHLYMNLVRALIPMYPEMHYLLKFDNLIRSNINFEKSLSAATKKETLKIIIKKIHDKKSREYNDAPPAVSYQKHYH